jgi:PRD1 phage membrane DNA delivery
MNKFAGDAMVILTGIITVAIIAVLVSNKAQTGNVITAFGKAFASDLGAAVSPVVGSSSSLTNAIQI